MESELQLNWPDPLLLDGSSEGLNSEIHARLFEHRFGADDPGHALLGGRSFGVYLCSNGHWVGFDSTDHLIGWLEAAVDEGEGKLYLPPLAPVVDESNGLLGVES